VLVSATASFTLGLVKVLFVNVSVPAKVAKVPVAPGKVMVGDPATAATVNTAVPLVAPVKLKDVPVAAPYWGLSRLVYLKIPNWKPYFLWSLWLLLNNSSVHPLPLLRYLLV
jgi:hypothetical protein